MRARARYVRCLKYTFFIVKLTGKFPYFQRQRLTIFRFHDRVLSSKYIRLFYYIYKLLYLLHVILQNAKRDKKPPAMGRSSLLSMSG
jgi:hypothetical protein